MVSALIGFVAGIAAKIIGDLALRDILRPVVRIEFRTGGSYVTETFTTDENGQHVSDCHYISVRVRNDGRTTAKNCRGFLVHLEHLNEDGRWVSIGDDVIQLNWAFGEDSERGTGYDLLPGMHRYLNVFWVDDRVPKQFIPATVTIPNRWQHQLNRHKATRFTVQVAAEEAESAVRVLTVEWGQQWNTYSVESREE